MEAHTYSFELLVVSDLDWLQCNSFDSSGFLHGLKSDLDNTMMLKGFQLC